MAVVSDWRAMKWSKLLTNLVANALPALLDRDAATVYADRRLFAVERAQILEALQGHARARPCADCAAGCRRPAGWPLGFRLPAAITRPVMRRVAGVARGGKAPSLLLHLRAGGGPSESAWLQRRRRAGGCGGRRPDAGQRGARVAARGGRRRSLGVGSHTGAARGAPGRHPPGGTQAARADVTHGPARRLRLHARTGRGPIMPPWSPGPSLPPSSRPPPPTS